LLQLRDGYHFEALLLADVAASASLSKTSTWSVHGPSLQQLIGEYAIHKQV
jgi:hypothetical protein